jgi:hypothetical protein
MATPNWSAARNGLTGDTNAVDKSAQIDQFLGTHNATPVYGGSPVVTPAGEGHGTDDPANFWIYHLDIFDYDQPFTMSGTNIGRLTIPLLPIGTGADLKVSLCADSSGSPGTVIASTIIPGSWINQFSQFAGVAAPSTEVIIEPTGNPLAVAAYTALVAAHWQSIDWSSPAVGSDGGATNPTAIQTGNFFVTVGGQNQAGTATVNSVFVVPYPGSGFMLGNTVPQPVLPAATDQLFLGATTDTLVVAGGVTNETSFTTTAKVYTASWDATNGIVGGWSNQTSLPSARFAGMCATSGENIYIIGGQNAAGNAAIADVLWATVQNGQITTWNVGPPLPVATWAGQAFVCNGWLVVFGGLTTANTVTASMYYAAINSDGSLGTWQSGPNMPTPITAFNTASDPTIGVYQVCGFTDFFSTTSSAMQSITFDATTGPAQLWSQQVNPLGSSAAGCLLFPVQSGQWQVFIIFGSSYQSAPVFAVPQIPVPMVVSGLTSGTTYHILLQQQGGTRSSYLRTCLDFNALPGNPTSLFRTRGTSGSWNTFAGGEAIPITVYSQSSGGRVFHTWDDSGVRTSTFTYRQTPDRRLIAISEGVQFLDGTVGSSVNMINYPSPAGWPPTSITELA